MDLFSILYQFLLLWFFLYIIIFTLRFISTRKKESFSSVGSRRKPINSILPTSSFVNSDNYELTIQRDQWSIKLFQVKYTTQRLNGFFHYLTTLAPKFWKVWFTCGAVIASFLMAVGIAVILFAAAKILYTLGHAIVPSAQAQNGDTLRKRSLDMEIDDEQVFLPMIPGVTLPMSHIGYYLCALIICGLFHEAGHAIAAYSQGIHIQSSGMFVIYLYPGAFVNIPDQQLQTLKAFQQLQIICAGVWHNLVLYLYTYISLAGGLKLMLLFLGWQSLEGQGGVSVVHVRPTSPLAAHIPPSSIIYQLDDYPLVNNIEEWNQYLLNDKGKHTIQQGFCIDDHQIDQDLGLDCCQIDEEYPFGKSTNASISCFATYPFMPESEKLCLATVR
ncbi:hypothetical protein BDF20DRAFT_856656 [Mycotypha africana]|uniref:uncharacterized protein n=1 Tax=Mycotypha africana TaxID=64632 RepID=UPI00230050F3|nr:uncharacterized protein BDF20DRAFT_856656 [Mycotypha africana]KAI8988605.1 hypothetical protein BDF20DRAFT_856656 [Mycotypha africana]